MESPRHVINAVARSQFFDADFQTFLTAIEMRLRQCPNLRKEMKVIVVSFKSFKFSFPKENPDALFVG